ncbi:hypothetical protein ACFW04_014221 [Cataglyphis niger]
MIRASTVHQRRIESDSETEAIVSSDQWHETNCNEIKRFFGLIIWMGLVNPNNRLSKIIHIIDHLNNNFKKYNSDEMLCVDESLVPFRGRIVFRQYFFLNYVVGPGYTYSFQIYTDKDENVNRISGDKSSEIVMMSFCKDILGKSDTICTDNWYTSVDLAEKLITMHIHLVDTLRKNRRGNPKQVVSQKLKRGVVIARENENDITVLKWKDKRDVLILFTKHSAEMATVQKKCCSYEKPSTRMVECNLGKSSVSLSDQMTAYSSPLRKTVKWYKKLAIELLVNICIVNSMMLFKQVTQKNISISDFRIKSQCI